MNFEEIVDQFNDGEFDAELYFNDYNTFFNVLNKRGLIPLIDIDNSNVQNHLLIYLYEKDRPRFYDFVQSQLSDIVIDKNGNIYLDLNNKFELSEFFCKNSRNSISRDYIESVLDGESYESYYDDTTNDVYDDVIENLNPKNTKYLQEYIVENLKNEKIEPETDKLLTIAENQGHPEYFTVDDLITAQDIISDEESMNFLLENNLNDLKYVLYNVHSSAYNDAYYSMIYNNIWDELQTYVNGDGEFYNYPHKFKKGVITQRFRIPVASNFDNVILDYLDSNKNFGSRGLLEYWGDYMRIVEEEDCLTVSINDYPSFREVDDIINEIFNDYI